VLRAGERNTQSKIRDSKKKASPEGEVLLESGGKGRSVREKLFVKK